MPNYASAPVDWFEAHLLQFSVKTHFDSLWELDEFFKN